MDSFFDQYVDRLADVNEESNNRNEESDGEYE